MINELWQTCINCGRNSIDESILMVNIQSHVITPDVKLLKKHYVNSNGPSC